LAQLISSRSEIWREKKLGRAHSLERKKYIDDHGVNGAEERKGVNMGPSVGKKPARKNEDG